jgi:hypothetical protein
MESAELDEILKKPLYGITKEKLYELFDLVCENLPAWVDFSKIENKKTVITLVFTEAVSVMNECLEDYVDESPDTPVRDLIEENLPKHFVIGLGSFIEKTFENTGYDLLRQIFKQQD